MAQGTKRMAEREALLKVRRFVIEMSCRGLYKGKCSITKREREIKGKEFMLVD